MFATPFVATPVATMPAWATPVPFTTPHTTALPARRHVSYASAGRTTTPSAVKVVMVKQRLPRVRKARRPKGS